MVRVTLSFALWATLAATSFAAGVKPRQNSPHMEQSAFTPKRLKRVVISNSSISITLPVIPPPISLPPDTSTTESVLTTRQSTTSADNPAPAPIPSSTSSGAAVTSAVGPPISPPTTAAAASTTEVPVLPPVIPPVVPPSSTSTGLPAAASTTTAAIIPPIIPPGSTSTASAAAASTTTSTIIPPIIPTTTTAAVDTTTDVTPVIPITLPTVTLPTDTITLPLPTPPPTDSSTLSITLPTSTTITLPAIDTGVTTDVTTLPTNTVIPDVSTTSIDGTTLPITISSTTISIQPITTTTASVDAGITTVITNGGTTTALVITPTSITSSLPVTTGTILTGSEPGANSTDTSILATATLPMTTNSAESVVTPVTSGVTASGTAAVAASGTSAAASAAASGSSTSTASQTPLVIVPLATPTAAATISPTGTDSMSSFQIPSSIILQSASPTVSSGQSAQTGIPSNLPLIINPPNNVIPTPPENSTLIQIAFLSQLNYAFVVNNPTSVAQIFQYLPMGLSFGLSIPESQVVMQTLQPYDTTSTLGYVTTVAFAYIPHDMVDTLALSVRTRSAILWQNPNPSVNTLMKIVNPSFPVLAGSGLGSSGSTPGGDQSPSTPSGSLGGGGAPISGSPNGSDGSGSIKGTSVGIGLGVCAGAALYGAAMFWIARRYRAKRQLHRRSPSLIDTSSMAQSHGEMLTGAGAALIGTRGFSGGEYTDAYYGNSGRNSHGSGSSRGREISGPVTAENSLGWN